MTDPNVRKIGEVDGIDGERLVIGVDYDTVAVYFGAWMSADGARLTSSQVAQFAQMLAAAAWQAQQQSETPPAAEPDWRFEWELIARGGDGNAVLKHKATGGRYRIIPEEDL